MPTKTSLLIFICLFGLFNLKEIEKIHIGEKTEFTYSINKKQTFSLKFPKHTKPKNLRISIESSNSLNQIISFSNSDPECNNGEKYKTKKSDFFLDNYQLSGKRKYLCIECAENTDCEFKLSFKPLKKGQHLEEKEILLKNFFLNLDNEVNLQATTEINLYILSNTYSSVLQLPSDRKKLYQIPGTGNTYKVSGSSVAVSSAGTVYPKNTTWYWYGGIGYSTPVSGKTPTSVTTSFNTGKSTVTVTASDKTVTTYVFNVLDYATEYADNVLKEFASKNITNTMTNYEKFKTITSFPAQYPYNGSYSGYVSMIIMKGGDCWGSAYCILKLCDLVGIKAHLRYGANEPGSGTGHRNVAALIDGKVYIGEAGYGYSFAPRPYHVSEENTGFYLKTNSVTKTASLVQYDGFEENIVVPSKIDDYTINELGKNAFYFGEAYSGVSVKSVNLPDTIEIIGNWTFASLKSISAIKIPKNVKSVGIGAFSNLVNVKEISVDSSNKYLYSDSGVLYTYDKTKLIVYPTSKEGTEYNVLSTVTEVAGYAFYYTKYVNKLTLPSGVKSVGEGAFGDSKLNVIYFSGTQPEFALFVFASLNATVYYPKNKNWDTSKIDINRAKQINFVEYGDSASLSFIQSSNAIAWVIAIIVLVVVLGLVGYVGYKKKFANSDSVEDVNEFGKFV